MNLLRSMEALLYELSSWLIFYPLTFWRCVRHPVRMMAYAESELSDKPDEQYTDALSPPLFLFLTIILAHLVELKFAAENARPFMAVLGTEQNLLLFRAVVFSFFPLVLGVERVRQKGLPLTRATLRPAFYSQCYLAAPLVFAVDLAVIIGHRGDATGIALGWTLFGVGLLWYVGSLTEWLAVHRKASRWRAALLATSFVALGLAVLLALLLVVAYAMLH